MAIRTFAAERQILLENISWETYERLLREVGERPIRLTYDEGDLEIMSLSFGHENVAELAGRLVETVTLELDIPLCSGGSTTLKKRLKRKGLEPDKCYWIKNAERMRGKKEWRAKQDPPPDLAVEVDVTSSSLDRMRIYAALRIPEIWRYFGKKLHFYELGPDATYLERDTSLSFPFLTVAHIEEVLKQRETKDETTLVRDFAAWVRSEILPEYEAARQHRAGRKNGKKAKP